MPFFKKKQPTLTLEEKKDKLVELYDQIALSKKNISAYQDQITKNRSIINEIGERTKITTYEIDAQLYHEKAEDAVSNIPPNAQLAQASDDLQTTFQEVTTAETKMKQAEKSTHLALEITKNGIETSQKLAKRQEKIDKHTERIAEIDAHNKRVLNEWAAEVSEIKDDFIEDNRRISEQNRQRRNR